MSASIEDRVVAMISAAGKIPVETIEPHSTLEELEIDSLVIVEIAFKLRKEFNISNEIDQQLDQAETVEDIFNLIRKSQLSIESS